MNFTDAPAIRNPREFLAVILAGFGAELQPLTSNYGDQPCPKALLPICNKPILSYVLNWVEESGIQDVLVICPTTHRENILHHVNSDPSSSSTSTLNIDVQTFDDQSPELPAGTTSILAHFTSKIQGDFVLLPCDFVPPPSLRLETVLNKFRVESTSDGALATALFYERPVPAKVKGGAEDVDAWGPLPDALPIVYDEKTGTLLHIDTLDDRDRNEEELDLRMSLLNRYPRVKMTTKFADAHVYVCRHAALQALQEKKTHFDSIREEFMPWLCKVQTQRTKREKYNHVLNPITNTASAYSLALQHSTLYALPKKNKLHHARPASPARSAHSQSTTKPSQPSSPTHDSDEEPEEEPSLRIGLVIHRKEDGYAARANDPWNYMELNRMALKNIPPQSYDSALVDPKCNISADSLVGDSSRVGERTSVKRSVVGRHCVLGKNVKLNGCVLMEYCVVEDGAKLEGCILGKNTHVGPKAELVRCITQAGYEVEANGVFKSEKLEVSDWTAAPTESEEEEESEEDGSGDNDDGDDDDDDDESEG